MRIGEHELRRCPVLDLEPREQQLAQLWNLHAFEGASPLERLTWPTWQRDAVRFLDDLLGGSDA